MENTVAVFTSIEQKRGFFSLVDTKLHLASFDTSKSRDLDGIFVGRITNILQNLSAAFVEYKKGVFGFLPLNRDELKTYKCEMLLPVQVVKDAVKTKEAVLSTEISMAGLYCIVARRKSPKSKKISFSKKLPENVKTELGEFCAPYIPEPVICIIRTNAMVLTKEDYPLLAEEIQRLSGQLERFVQISSARTVYSQLYNPREDFIIRQLSKLDFMHVSKIVTDSSKEFDQISQCLPESMQAQISLYEDVSFPLQALYGLRGKISEAVNRIVWLKSGGYLVIDPTEALTVIDVNSGKNLKKISKRELCALTNREAAEVIPYILSSRNISGIIIVDFISTDEKDEDAKLMKIMRMHTALDYVKTDIVDMTPLGLLEMTRQKRDIPLTDQLREVGIYEAFKH